MSGRPQHRPHHPSTLLLSKPLDHSTLPFSPLQVNEKPASDQHEVLTIVGLRGKEVLLSSVSEPSIIPEEPEKQSLTFSVPEQCSWLTEADALCPSSHKHLLSPGGGGPCAFKSSNRTWDAVVHGQKGCSWKVSGHWEVREQGERSNFYSLEVLDTEEKEGATDHKFL